MKEFKPQDATTNPSLVYAATQKQQYGRLLGWSFKGAQELWLTAKRRSKTFANHLLVQFGCDILEICTRTMFLLKPMRDIVRC